MQRWAGEMLRWGDEPDLWVRLGTAEHDGNLGSIELGRNGIGRALATLVAVLLTFAITPTAAAKSCDGPDECCPTEVRTPTSQQVVALGVVLLGLYNVNEKAGTWDADFYLNESWTPAAGFTPTTEIVNEVGRQSEQFDDTELRSGRCYRSRRLHSTLRSSYNLRMFPFDRQRLTLEFSDAEVVANLARYTDKPSVAALDDGTRGELSSWKVDGELTYSRRARVFAEDGTAAAYDYATFSLPVRRHVTFHLTKFFLPLFVIIAVAFTVFWIDPEDLNSKAAIGVTCLLAAIAFQLAEAGALPEVAYLTFADRVYAVCYTMLAASLMFAVYGNSLVRKDRKERALRLDRLARLVFPGCTVLALILAIARSASQGTQ